MSVPTAEPALAEGPSAAYVQPPQRLPVSFLGIYGSGALVEVLISFSLNNFLLFYLTIVCGLSGGAAGLVALISLGLDFLVDPLVGSISDNTKSRLGRRNPFMIAACLPSGLALVLLFSIPQSLHGGALLAYATILSLTLRTCLSLFQVPYFALGAEISSNYVERSTIVAFRMGMGVVGTFAATLLSYRVFFTGHEGQMHRAAYQPLALCFAAIILVAGMTAGLGTLGARSRLSVAPAGGGPSMARFVAEVKEIFSNPSFRILFIGCLAYNVGQGISTPLALHANTFFWRLPTKAIGDLIIAQATGLIAGIFGMVLLSARLEKRTLALTGLMLIIAAQFLPVPLQLSGLLPSPDTSFVTLCAAYFVMGSGVAAFIIGAQSMIADAADEHEHLFGARREALYFAGASLAAKASSGLGTLIAGLALDLIGFPHNVPKGAAVHIPANSVHELGLIYGPGAAFITLIALAIMSGYGLSKRRHAEILGALGQSRHSDSNH